MTHLCSFAVFVAASTLAQSGFVDEDDARLARDDLRAILAALEADDPAEAKRVVETREARPIAVPFDDGLVYRDAQRRAAETIDLSSDDAERLLNCSIPEVVGTTLGVVAGLGEAGRRYDDAVKRLAESDATSPELRAAAISCRFFIVPEDEAVLDRKNVGLFFGLSCRGTDVTGDLPEEMPTAETAGLALHSVGLSGTFVHTGHTRSELPALVHLLQNGSEKERLLVLLVLRNFGREAGPAAGAVSRYLDRTDDVVLKQYAGLLLAQFEDDPEEIAAIAARAGVPPDERESFIDGRLAAIKERQGIDEMIVEATLAGSGLDDWDSICTLDYALAYGRGNRVRLVLRALTPAAGRLPPAVVRRVEQITEEQTGETARLAKRLLQKARQPAGEPGAGVEEDASSDAAPDGPKGSEPRP